MTVMSIKALPELVVVATIASRSSTPRWGRIDPDTGPSSGAESMIWAKVLADRLEKSALRCRSATVRGSLVETKRTVVDS